MRFSVLRWSGSAGLRTAAAQTHSITAHFHFLRVGSYVYESMLRSICRYFKVLFKRFVKSRLSRMAEGMQTNFLSIFHKHDRLPFTDVEHLQSLLPRVIHSGEETRLTRFFFPIFETSSIGHRVPRLIRTYPFLLIFNSPEDFRCQAMPPSLTVCKGFLFFFKSVHLILHNLKKSLSSQLLRKKERWSVLD